MKFALFGFGHIGKVHQQAMQNSQKAELVAIIDQVKPEVELPHFTDVASLKTSGLEVDVIVIATPNGLHFEHAKASLEAGYHVLVEKPITLNSRDFERLIYIGEHQGKRIFNMLQLRFSPVVQWLKEALNENRLGEIYMVNVNCYWNRNAAYYQQKEWHGTKAMDGGVLFTQFSHFVDVLHYWFEELKPLDIRKFNFNHQDCTEFPDSGMLTFELGKEGFGHMNYTISTFEKNFESNITILAEKGTLQIGGQYMNEINYLNATDLENPFNEPIGNRFHQNAIEEIVDAIEQKRKSILDAENARNVIQFLEVVS